MRFYRFLCGYFDFSFPTEQYTALLNTLLKAGVACQRIECRGDRGYVRVSRRDAPVLSSLEFCRKVGEGGAPTLCYAFCRRPGLFIGAIMGVALLVLSSLTVWRVDVRGNTALGQTEVEEALREAGLAVGDAAWQVDVGAVQSRLLQIEPRIAWVGIYLRGTTASVEIREAERREAVSDEEGALRNLIAATDAVIESVYVKSGRATVSPGMTVKRGDLLVSGIYQTALGVNAVRAEGQVRGRCERLFTVTQPLDVTEKSYFREECASLLLDFFGKEIKLFKKIGKNAEKYDIIKRKEQVVLFGVLPLPLYVTRVCRLYYTEAHYRIGEEEAVAAAYSRMKGELAAAIANDELLSVSYAGGFRDNAYFLECRVTCVTDITAPLAYEVERDGG